MKKFFKIFLGRFLWVGLILLIELTLIILTLTVFRGVLEAINDWLYLIETTLLGLLDIIVMIYIVNSRANSAYKISWLFIVGLLPFFGTVLYLMFGNKNTTKRMKKKIAPLHAATKETKTSPRIIQELEEDRDGMAALDIANYINRESGSSLYDHTESHYFKNGEDVWKTMIEELKKAKHYIFLEYFIIEKGQFWNSIVDVLHEKAREGVDVRVMYDDVGSITTLPTNYPEQLRKLGIKCTAYNRLKPFVNIKLNNRDHRKILVIDGTVGFTGGINLADEYMNLIVRFGYWKDNALMIKGRGVYGLTMLFLQNWVAANGGFEELSDTKYLANNYNPTFDYENDGYVQPYGDLPFGDEAVGETVYLKLISSAKKYCYITTPYLIIDEEMENTLMAKAKSGVNVTLVVPHIPDKKMVFNVTRSYYGKLLEAGVHIYEYTPGFIHEKIFIVDDVMATVGTINLDYRSLYLHLENGVFIYKASIIKDMVEDYLDTLSKSEEITLERYRRLKKGKTALWALLRVAAPLM